MPFGRLHEEAAGDSKLLALTNAAWRMWGMGLIYCQKNLTDGFIPEGAIYTWGIREQKGQRVPDVATELCTPQVPGKAAVWQKVTGGFHVHDYLQWNDSKAEILKMRADAKGRIARWRERHTRDAEHGGVTGGVQNGDRNALPDASDNAHDVVRGEKIKEKDTAGPPRRNGRGAGVFAGSLPREHLSHVVCSENHAWCVPEAVHGRLASTLAPSYAGDVDAAAAALTTWYPTVWATLPPAFVMPDAFKFWRGRFDARFASQEAGATGNTRRSGVPNADETRERQRRLKQVEP
jgi:hypothetical protein